MLVLYWEGRIPGGRGKGGKKKRWRRLQERMGMGMGSMYGMGKVWYGDV